MKDTEAMPLMQEEPKENAVKDTKKLVEAFSAVFRHQHGEDPTQEDITKFLAGQAKEEQPEVQDNSPSILKYKVITGKTNKPLYFCDGNKWFDCDAEQWADKAPAVAAELNERPITTADLYYAIMHGLVDDAAYQQLNEKKLVPQESQKLYEKLQKLHQTVEDLKMSQEQLEKAMPDEEYEADELDDGMRMAIQESFSEDDMDFSHFPTEEVGTDVVAEIMRLAMEEGLAPELEAAIRRIVREELQTMQQPQQPIPAPELQPLSPEQISELE
jgi:hypothetical protein